MGIKGINCDLAKKKLNIRKTKTKKTFIVLNIIGVALNN
jgi:hypothetical protein